MSGNEQQATGHPDLTALIQARQLSVQQALARIHAERGGDARGFQVPCDACGTLVDLALAWSPVFWLAAAGHPAVTGFQMAESAQSGFPHQHYCCSEACVEKTLIACLHEHYAPEARGRIPS